MLTIPLSFFFYFYLAFLGIFVIFFLINLAHLVHTGTITTLSILVTLLVASYSLLVIALTWNFSQTIDWQTPITLWDINWIKNIL